MSDVVDLDEFRKQQDLPEVDLPLAPEDLSSFLLLCLFLQEVSNRELDGFTSRRVHVTLQNETMTLRIEYDILSESECDDAVVNTLIETQVAEIPFFPDDDEFELGDQIQLLYNALKKVARLPG